MRWPKWAPIILCLSILHSFSEVSAQSIIRGFVFDASTNERMIGAKVSVDRLDIEAFTNVDGRFIINADLTEALVLDITAKGYQSRSVTIYDTTVITVRLEHIFAQGYRNLSHHEAIKGSILNSDRNVDKIQGAELFAIANGQMLGGISNYASVYGYHSGLNNQVLGIREFTTAGADRYLTTVNGIDARLAGFGSVLGGFSAPADIDIASIELIAGCATSVFGEGAYQGSMSIQTKDPWNFSGLEARVYGGSSSALDAQMRFAQPFGKSRNWAVSASAQFQRIDDQAGVNEYGQHLSSVNLDSTIENPGNRFNSDQQALLSEFSHWLNNSGQGADPGILFPAHKGFTESEVFENEGRKLKLAAALHFKPSKNTEIKYAFRMSNGSMVYTNEQRYALHNLTWHEHNITAKGSNWNISAYGSFESTGNSYSIARNADLINEHGSQVFADRFLLDYADSLKVWSGNFGSGVHDSLQDRARSTALENARAEWLAPGTATFDSIAELGQNRNGSMNGAGFRSRSNRQGILGSYRFDLNWLQVHLGANFKRNAPVSDGFLFSDTTDISFLEYGGWTNFNFKLLKDRIEINAGLRVEKSDLTKIQIAPRVSVRFRIKEHALRASFNSGIRSPTYWEFFRSASTNDPSMLGNSGGVANVLNSILASELRGIHTEAVQNGNWPAGCPEGDLECLRAHLASRISNSELAQLQPERVNSVELGYRSVLWKNFYLDLSVYHSWHYNLISYSQYTLLSGSENDPETLVSNLVDSVADHQILVPSNSDQVHRTIGGSLLATYHFSDKIWANFNYSYSQLLDASSSSPSIGTNVPSSKINVGIRVKDLWQHLGFSLNYQFVGNYNWVGISTTETIPAYSVLDAQISYRIPVMYSTFRIGGSNIINSPIRQMAGGPSLNATFYAAIQFDLNVR